MSPEEQQAQALEAITAECQRLARENEKLRDILMAVLPQFSTEALIDALARR